MNGEELSARTWELDRTPDLVDLVSAARDAGHEVMLIERPMPDAVSVAAIGRAFDIVAAPGGVSLEDAGGRQIDLEKDANRIVAAARLWRRVASSEDAIAVADGTAVAGASPELLIRRSGNHAFSQPMAGSVARGATDSEDDRLGRQLSLSAKDRSEHRLVSKFVMDALRPLSSVVSAREPEVARFTNIQHLATSVEAKLSAPAADALTLAAALHPTPAVGGWPRVAADLLIDELESMERGWYAGGVGWIDGRGDGEFAVALRCGLLWEDGARLYAGVGVMPDSDPARELEETELKFKALLTALV